MRDICKGMWCLDEEGRLGLAAKDDVHGKDGKVVMAPNGGRVQEETFHLVDEAGNTTLVVYRGWAGLTQAPFNSIPPGRIEGQTRDDLAKLGYI